MNIAISGLSIQFPECQDAHAFRDLLLCGKSIPACRPMYHDPLQSLGEVCLAALNDAGCVDDRHNIAFLLVHSKVKTTSPLFNFTCSTEYLPAGHSWLFSTWQRARRLLSIDGFDTIVVAANETEGYGAAAVVFQPMEDVQH